MQARKHAIAAALAIAAVAFGGAASAQVVITQASITAGGITPGDTPGFPATLSATGSYVLGSNLSTAGLGAIEITGRNVSLNLGGHTIDGGNTCSLPTPSTLPGNTCSPPSKAAPALIEISGPHATVRNGAIVGGEGNGINVWGNLVTLEHAFSGYQLRDLTLAHNRDNGMLLIDIGGQVRNVKAYLNGTGGITASIDNLIENVSSSRNNFEGVFSYGRMSGQQIVSTRNGGTGVYTDSGTLTLSDASYNARDGFYGSTLIANSRSGNNAGNGIVYSNLVYETVLRDNAARSYVGGTSSCYARLFHRTSSAVVPQIQAGVALHGSVTSCP